MMAINNQFYLNKINKLHRFYIDSATSEIAAHAGQSGAAWTNVDNELGMTRALNNVAFTINVVCGREFLKPQPGSIRHVVP